MLVSSHEVCGYLFTRISYKYTLSYIVVTIIVVTVINSNYIQSDNFDHYFCDNREIMFLLNLYFLTNTHRHKCKWKEGMGREGNCSHPLLLDIIQRGKYFVRNLKGNKIL